MNDDEIQDERTLGEAYQNKRAGNINAMVDKYNESRSQVYSVAGNYTFVVPDLVTRLTVTGAGGGAGGRGFGSVTGFIFGAPVLVGGLGGSGGEVYTATLNVTPGQNISVTVGAGGTRGLAWSGVGSYTISFGGTGGTSSFGSLQWLGGVCNNNIVGSIPAGVGNGSQSPARVGGFSGNGGDITAAGIGADPQPGEDTIYASGGLEGQTIPDTFNGSGGGASYGQGGEGGLGIAPFTDPTAGVFGGGGGGAGGSGSSGNGANGGSGIIIVRW